MARDDMVDIEVKQKCNTLFRQWAVAYKNTPGLERVAQLYKQLPYKSRPQPAHSKVLRETEAEAHDDDEPSSASPATPTHTRSTSSAAAGSSTFSTASMRSPAASTIPVALGAAPLPSSSIFKKDKKSKNKPFNLEKEKPQLLQTIAQSSVASTNLLNGLQLINREVQRVSDNPEVVKRFETCKLLRRQILRYIQLVESDQWIGSLLSANDELVKALMAYEIMDKSIEDDSDSEAEAYAGKAPVTSSSPPDHKFAGLSLNERENAPPPKPPRPGGLAMPTKPDFGKHKHESEDEPEDDDDDDDPFADRNAVKTPYAEKDEITW
jgi:LAS seventeen-binding protein 5